MKHTAVLLLLPLLLVPSLLSAQAIPQSYPPASSPSGGQVRIATAKPGQAPLPAKNLKPAKKEFAPKPFSQLAIGAGFGVMGVNLQAATNLNRYMNLRAVGNVFNYDINNISTNGFNISGKLNMASAGASVDIFPFPTHGLRVSPGVLFYNQNAVSATFAVQGGTSFSLNDIDYYASSTNPVQGTGNFGLHAQNPAFTITTGYGNIIPRKGGHLSFPFELGVALVGAPVVNVALTQGQVCNAQGQFCVDIATDPTVQANLQAQVAKYKSDLDPLKTFPILNFGVAYNFHLRQ